MTDNSGSSRGIGMMLGLNPKYVGEKFQGEQKFIVSRHPTESDRLYIFNFYAVDLWPDSNEEPDHDLIVEGFKIQPEHVLGGGRVRRASPIEVLLYGSSKYDGVPRKFLEFFKDEILRGYHRKFPGIDSIVIDTPDKTVNDERVSFIDEFLEQIRKEKSRLE